MNAEEFFKDLSEQDKLAVINVALPGINTFFEEVLVEENLSEKGEKIRLDFVDILGKLSSRARAGEIFSSLNNDQEPLEQSPETRTRRSGDDLESNTEHNTVQAHWAEETAVIDKKESAENLPCRKGTDSTEESGIFLCSTSLPQSDATVHKDTLDLPMLDSVDVWSREAIISDTGSAEFEILDGWESDAYGHEEGYFTEDNVFVDYLVHKLDLQPNELGELHSGVMYIREHPGWHKRWFTINDHCLTCFQHRSETKMLFQIPLKGAKIIPTDRKKSRMFPITLSVPRIHETITFATTEEHSRQEWVYVVTYVISRLVEDEDSSDIPESQSFISYDTYLKLIGEESGPDRNSLAVQTLEKHDQSRRRKLSSCLDSPKMVEPRNSWRDDKDNAHSNVLEASLAQWKIGLDDEDEMLVMDGDLAPGLDEEESFKELQEILPDIIQGCKVSSTGGKKKMKFSKTNSLGKVGSGILGGSFLSTTSIEGKSSSTSDLQIPGSKVKRHGSLVTSLSSKAMRVKSRITGSFFSKGRKDDIPKSPSELSFFQSTTFSGYLLRKKGPNWKNRWCVVKEHCLFCYKDFGIGTAELEVPLHETSIRTLEESDPEKPHMFMLTCDKEELLFAAENEAELEEWIMVLKDEIETIESSPVPVTDLSERTELSASPTEAHSQLSASGSPSVSENKAKNSRKRNKDLSPAGGKKTTIFSSLGHKLTKSKPKVIPSGTFYVSPAVDVSTSTSVENEFVVVPHASNVKSNQGDSSVTEKHNKVERLQVSTSHSMEGFLNQRVEEDTWLKCWVKLENHTLHIHDDKDSTDSVVVKIKLSNCVVKDWSDAQRSFVMEIRRALGQPHYLQAENETEYLKWKTSISGSVVHSPKVKRNPVLTWSSTEDDRTNHVPATSLLLQSKADSVERDEVFQKIEETSTSQAVHPLRPDTPLNPSPRPSTAGDVSNSESDECEPAVQAVPLSEPVEEPVERWRSFSEGEKEEERKTRIKLHRSISNAIPVFPRFPGKRKRRSRTVPNVNVSPDLLVNIKQTSCLFMRIGKGLWTKRWCVLQEDKLHLFRRADEVVPILTIPLKQCEVRRANKKTKKFSFEVNVPSEKEDYCFAADDEKEMLNWMRMLRAIAEDESADNSFSKEQSVLVNGEAVHDSKVSEQHVFDTIQPTNQSPADTKQNKNTTHEPGPSYSEDLAKNGELLTSSDGAEGSSSQSPTSLSAAMRPTSLDGVLKLLQDQQLIQQLGQQKFNKARRVQNAWRRSATAALMEQRSGSGTPDLEKGEPMYPATAVSELKGRTQSMTIIQAAHKERDLIPSSPYQGANEIIERFEKLAEEEKLRTLKKETLLKKRRNSLTLEKDVLKKNISKQHDKKKTVKKLIGKDETASIENKQRVEERIQQVNQELASIERNLMDNKMNEAQALDNINVMKTKTVRRLSFVRPTGNRVQVEQKREAFKSSHSESSSSQGSTEDKSGKDSPKAQQSLEAARKKNTVVSLAMLENELRKISPVGGRKLTLASSNINNNNISKESKTGRVSVSSEGSAPDDYALKDSPILDKKLVLEKRVSSGSEGSGGDQSSLPRANFSDSAELRRKRYSATGPQVAFHSVSVEIPTEDEDKPEERKHKFSVTSQKGVDEGVSRKTSVTSEKGSDEHRVSLKNALSQIKDFEEFAAVSRNDRCTK